MSLDVNRPLHEWISLSDRFDNYLIMNDWLLCLNDSFGTLGHGATHL